ncbi:sensor histidine kinase [Texcoconibacillus texcoconensis]|uniref:histidine kinase n=1 Tax=Texcoconibacillus texcoconensis TaxID=1095777 RepID=A0A840QT77_9BACI|nr:sensor histidine kinase [Texcoconibacillus texcoconensis]MBB5174746.1 two-component system sporulation sensor kinase B [Texcoconibacillus texcoconensis]
MDIDVLLLNILFILLPLFLIYMIFSLLPTMGSTYKRGIITVFSLFSIIMCMQYTIELADGFYFDLRTIPFTITVLYAGYKVGFWVLLGTLLYRFSLGGDGFVVSLILYTAIFIIVAMISRKFYQYSLKVKLLLPIFMMVFFHLIMLFNYTLNLQLDFLLSLSEWVMLASIVILGILFVTLLIEFLIKISRIQEELIQTEKLRVTSELSASISHEVKNPLTVARGFVQLLMEDKVPVEKQKTYFSMVIQELDRANHILSDYLTFSKPKMEQVEKLNLTTELKKVIELIRPLATMKGIELNVSIEDTGFINGDKVKFHQCMLNVLKNSVEAMEQGGWLEVKTKRHKNKCEITVKDNGIGMTPDEVNRLGTPYYSTKDQGTGLGMMVAFSIIKAMEGTILIHSEYGKGTEMIFTLPLTHKEIQESK